MPAGHYTDVLMTRDTNPLEPKNLEFKFYAKGVGPVLAVSVSGAAIARSSSASHRASSPTDKRTGPRDVRRHMAGPATSGVASVA